MTHPDLIERITRSLAYMLRHQPEQFDLELDEFGWADLREVVRALNERLGEAVSEEDVQDAVSSGDRQRYEIDRGMIRALYGHSIDVQPGEPSQPPELLYVGVSRQDAERAERFGLRPGRRRFLHLALTSEDALETAARSSEDVVLVKVHALDAWEEGISFYDRKALFLSDPIPTHYLEISEVAPREESFAGAHAGAAESFTEEAPAASDAGGPPQGYAPRGPGDGGGGRRRGRRGGRGRGRDFSDDRRPPSGEPAQERAPDRGAPRPYDDRPRQPQQARDDRPRQGYGGGGGGGGGPRHGGGAPRPPQGGGGYGGGHGGHRSEQGGPRGGGGGGFRDDRGRGFRDDRPRHDAPRHDAPRHDAPRHDAPRHDAPRRDDRGQAPEREAWQRRDERRPAPPPAPPRSEPPPAPPAPVVEPPKRPARPARRESTGDGGFGAGL